MKTKIFNLNNQADRNIYAESNEEKLKREMKESKTNLIAVCIELNHESIPNSNITYSIFFNEKKKEFICKKDPNKPKWVSYDDTPNELRYKLTKDITKFNDEEKQSILDYSGLKLKTDGFELRDIFMEGSYIKFIK